MTDAKPDFARLFEAVPLFASLNRSQRDALADKGKELSFREGQVIIRKGDAGVGFYLIMDGEVEIRRGGKLLATLSKGQFFGEMSMIDGSPRSADVVAIKPTRCFTLTAWSFAGVINTNPRIALAIMKELAHRLRSMDATLAE